MPSLFDLAPGGVYHARPVTNAAVRSYRTLSPLPGTMVLQGRGPGGLLSVALSLKSPSPGVTRHRIFVEPGLSSKSAKRIARPSGHLARFSDEP
ncbi:hypothetical protein JCM17846_17080 [Iodidimonas nitroreducens]|uniref:Uncharacterized protein n=1 Tax=Iodidimonas nitroreducens TaxID=1236968 RepID=A0A5A7NAN0_9PROT|nr:hypothetical protein JCM17846_17080 [Iodidimonas nitroreducens]